MTQVKTFVHYNHEELDILVNNFLKDIEGNGYDLLDLYYNSLWNHTQNYSEYSATILYGLREDEVDDEV